MNRALEYVAAVQEELRDLEALTGAWYRYRNRQRAGVYGWDRAKSVAGYAAVGASWVNLGTADDEGPILGEVMADENVQSPKLKFNYRGEGHQGF